jgi:hypothetical protein
MIPWIERATLLGIPGGRWQATPDVLEEARIA